MEDGAIVVDEAYVISDLHLGGEPPFQMFREGPALAALIDGLSPAAPPGSRRALVINGDFVDFLAERTAHHFDAEGAIRKLGRIASDDAFAPVFAALKRFIASPGNVLAITIGNHDVELALPWVRQALEQILCASREQGSGRLVWSLQGEGLLLRIGSTSGPKVLCVHGNEVDAWNVVDHEAIRRFARDGLRGRRSVADYIPNAGSRMVVEVMNGIKQRYPFVDLLKPETQAVIPTLLAIDASAASALAALPGIAARQKSDQLRIAAGWLGQDPNLEPMPAQLSSAARVSKTSELDAQRQLASQFLDHAEAALRSGQTPDDAIADGSRAEALGLGRAIFAAVRGKGRVEVLRQQLAELVEDRTFDLSDRDATYRDMDARVSTNIDFLVTGHTHLPRAIEREFGRSYYFNTGTWARVFRIRKPTLESSVEFEKLYRALSAGDMCALDDAPGLEPMRPHLAAFWKDANGVHGQLRTVDATAPFAQLAVSGTTFTRT
jgi:UDP-2,3-diacylglucosamine pyrophosphatase LpxH